MREKPQSTFVEQESILKEEGARIRRMQEELKNMIMARRKSREYTGIPFTDKEKLKEKEIIEALIQLKNMIIVRRATSGREINSKFNPIYVKEDIEDIVPYFPEEESPEAKSRRERREAEEEAEEDRFMAEKERQIEALEKYGIIVRYDDLINLDIWNEDKSIGNSNVKEVRSVLKESKLYWY